MRRPRRRGPLGSLAAHRGVPTTALRPALTLIKVEIVLLGVHLLSAALGLYPWLHEAFVPVLGSMASVLLLLLLASPLLALQRTPETVPLPRAHAVRLQRRAVVIALLSLLPALGTAVIGVLGSA